ncbi:MAG: hypothetical protein K2K79_06190 [Paramuribaculum sp.]|nr:hypothetical protein [Paramuribaculum sp.]
MIDTPTHKSIPAAPGSASTESSMSENRMEPRKATIEFLRQFARCYIPGPIATGAAVVILN